VTKGLFAMGHTVELSLHESDALPLEAGGANRRPDIPALTPDSTFLLGKRPHAGLSTALRGDLFSAPRARPGGLSSEAASGDAEVEPPGEPEARDGRGPSGRPSPYVLTPPSEEQIRVTGAQRAADIAFLEQSASRWPLINASLRKAVNCT
jgi:hypothetical protein